MIRFHEGPTFQEYAPLKQKVCDACKWCKASKMFGQRTVEILLAECSHPDSRKNLFGNALDFDRESVFTPDWCPIEKA